MNQESNSIDSHDVEELLSDRHFPAFPFKDETWRGLFLNRDLHGLGGMPKGIFDALITQLEARGAMPLWFVPAVTLRSGEDVFPYADIDGWGRYIDLLGCLGFFPEYYLVSADRSILLWFDSETVLVGGGAELINAIAGNCGSEEMARLSAEEFGVTLDDQYSDVAAFIRRISGLD
ncbi:hypothetical protein ACYX79_08840 [Stenotrophomonas rhizophila]